MPANRLVNIIPIAIDVPTGKGTVLLPTMFAVDARGHVSSTLDARQTDHRLTACQSANGPFAETLLTINTATGVVQRSRISAAGAAFSGNGIAWRPEAP